MSDTPNSHDAPPATADPLAATIAEARREEAQVRASREARDLHERASARRRRRLLNTVFVASAAACAAALWITQRVAGPTPADLAAGRDLALSIAAEAIREHVARTGAAPASAAALVPGLPQIRIEPQPGGVVLSMPAGDGSGPTRQVDVPPLPTAPTRP